MQHTQRTQWVQWLDRIAAPVLAAAGRGRLRQDLPPIVGRDDRAVFAPSEALCRTLVGLAPWLETDAGDAGDADERRLRDAARANVTAALDYASREGHPDRLPLDIPGQPLVEAAFLSHALLRMPKFAATLPQATRQRLLALLLTSRITKPCANNWLLFSAMVETLRAAWGQDYDAMRIDYALLQHAHWYAGDGVYMDGPRLHQDYYNSFVIQPMMLDILQTMNRIRDDWTRMIPAVEQRFTRCAQALERMISPEGTYPILGRSIAYRFGCFQALAQAALQHRLPADLAPSQVREGLSAVIRRCLNAPETFTADGWLNIGVAGHQDDLGELYISRGSIYLCCAGLLALGLPAGDGFWSDPPQPWTNLRVWSGQPIPCDHAID
jgi:hypothetical protein